VSAAEKAKSGETVSVGCKLPNGLILRLQELVEIDYPIMGGGVKTVKEWRPHPTAPTFTVFGNRAKGAEGEEPPCLVVGGYAITPNIPKDFWDEWVKQNKDLEPVKQNLIFAHEKADNVRGISRDQKALVTGLEPIRPGKDPRIPKRRNPESGKVEDVITTGSRS